MGVLLKLRRCVHRLGRRPQPVRTRTSLSAGRPIDGQPDAHPTFRWSPIRLPGRGSPTLTTWIRATRSRSSAARACRLRPGRAWSALVNQGRAAAADSPLNSTSPTDTQQALYTLPQADFNAITSGTNGYTATAGYNLVTGLGTPVANLLVPDLIAYQGAGTTYSGSTVAPLQNSGLVSTGPIDGGPMDVYSVFDSFTVTQVGLRQPHAQGSNRLGSELGHGTYAAGRASLQQVSCEAARRQTMAWHNPCRGRHLHGAR